jgi:hypothetical protein
MVLTMAISPSNGKEWQEIQYVATEVPADGSHDDLRRGTVCGGLIARATHRPKKHRESLQLVNVDRGPRMSLKGG